MAGPGEHGELAVRQQAGHADRVLHRHHVGVADHDERRRLDGSHLVVRPVLEAVQALHQLRHQHRKLREVGRRIAIGLAERRRHVRRVGRLPERLPDRRGNPVLRDEACGHHQPSHQLGMPACELQGGVGAIAEAQHVGLGDGDLPQQCRHVVGILREAQRTSAIRRVAVPLQLDGDDLTGGREHRQHAAEGRLDGRAASLQQDERAPGAAHRAVPLVVHAQAADRRVATHAGVVRRRAPVRAGHAPHDRRDDRDGGSRRSRDRSPAHPQATPSSSATRRSRPSRVPCSRCSGVSCPSRKMPCSVNTRRVPPSAGASSTVTSETETSTSSRRRS